jgi:hypothetical protein
MKASRDLANDCHYRLAGLEKELGLKGYDYNTVLSVFYISYIIFELPSNMACKWVGPGWFIPFLTLCFGIASIGTAFVDTMGQICAVRFILGIVSDTSACFCCPHLSFNAETQAPSLLGHLLPPLQMDILSMLT